MLFTVVAWAEKQVIEPMLGDKFGVAMVVELEFVEKPDTYFAQRIIKTEWMAKVISLDGKALKVPVEIEYASNKDSFKKGVCYRFLAYEDVYSHGPPKGWMAMQQFNYGIRHRLVLGRSVSGNVMNQRKGAD
ncbi:hypothetical protein ACFQY0_05250 [Haloferula chungangensis]|uniref:Uncharacterized protein n=1 Tax=Haloferula chungangensis TaxID=1048331 RepID=A0ABW2L651_9BACT